MSNSKSSKKVRFFVIGVIFSIIALIAYSGHVFSLRGVVSDTITTEKAIVEEVSSENVVSNNLDKPLSASDAEHVETSFKDDLDVPVFSSDVEKSEYITKLKEKISAKSSNFKDLSSAYSKNLTDREAKAKLKAELLNDEEYRGLILQLVRLQREDNQSESNGNSK